VPSRASVLFKLCIIHPQTLTLNIIATERTNTQNDHATALAPPVIISRSLYSPVDGLVNSKHQFTLTTSPLLFSIADFTRSNRIRSGESRRVQCSTHHHGSCARYIFSYLICESLRNMPTKENLAERGWAWTNLTSRVRLVWCLIWSMAFSYIVYHGIYAVC
jgi:hypothetical protein